MEDTIHGYLDESLSEEEMAGLAAWIRETPENAQQFAVEAMLHDRLQGEVVAAADEAKEKNVLPFPTRWWVAAAALMVGLLVVWQLVPSVPGGSAFVTVLRGDGAELRKGERSAAREVTIGEEAVRLVFDSGVEVAIQGPASFELVDAERLILGGGLLTAQVPPGAEGFRVDTPTAEIIDLGTSFGVHFDADGASHVSVFDGEVEVAEPVSGLRKRLLEGEEVIVSEERKIEGVEMDVKPYEKLWPVSSGIAGSTGSFKLAPPWPRRLGLHYSSESILVVPDGIRTEIETPLRVNVSQPGKVETVERLSPAVLPAKSVLRSYILQFRPVEVSPRRFPSRLQGTITFDQPVEGLIVLYEEMRDSAGRFSTRKTGEVHANRQLELTGDSKGDRLELSEDRRTLRVDLAASRKAFDLIRVVVDARPPGISEK